MKIEISEIPENVEKIVIDIDTTNNHIEYTNFPKTNDIKFVNQETVQTTEKEHPNIPEEMNSEF